MKVKVTFDVTPADRYLIARYFREAGTSFPVKGPTFRARKRRVFRATRKMVARYARGAVRLCLEEYLEAAQSRTKTITVKLKARELIERDPPIAPPAERSRRLFS